MSQLDRSDTPGLFRTSIWRVMGWSGAIFLLLGSLYLIELKVSNSLSLRRFMVACAPENVFRVSDSQSWSELKQAAREQIEAGKDDYLVVYKRSVWKQDNEVPQIHKGITIIRYRDVEVAQFNDAAYAPRDILSDLNIMQPVHITQCSWRLYLDGDLGAKIVYDLGKVELDS